MLFKRNPSKNKVYFIICNLFSTNSFINISLTKFSKHIYRCEIDTDVKYIMYINSRQYMMYASLTYFTYKYHRFRHNFG